MGQSLKCRLVSIYFEIHSHDTLIKHMFNRIRKQLEGQKSILQQLWGIRLRWNEQLQGRTMSYISIKEKEIKS